jgi:hypothetical protein
MEHEFVPGKRRCRICAVKWGYRNNEPCFDPDLAVAPEPEKSPQVWHLNVWTSVNGVIFTGSATAPDGNTTSGLTEAVRAIVRDIIAEYTPKEDPE